MGWIDNSITGKLYIRDWMGRICGWYDIRTNLTCDKQGRIVGRGNLLTTLLPPRP